MDKEPLEKDIQNEICKYLEENRYFFWRQNTTPIFQKDKYGLRFRRMPKYAISGISDIIIFTKKDGVIFMEVKRPKRALNDNQIKFRDKCLEYNVKYFMVTGVEDIIKLGF